MTVVVPPRPIEPPQGFYFVKTKRAGAGSVVHLRASNDERRLYGERAACDTTHVRYHARLLPGDRICRHCKKIAKEAKR